jgi:hypothetical protein
MCRVLCRKGAEGSEGTSLRLRASSPLMSSDPAMLLVLDILIRPLQALPIQGSM